MRLNVWHARPFENMQSTVARTNMHELTLIAGAACVLSGSCACNVISLHTLAPAVVSLHELFWADTEYYIGRDCRTA